MFDLESLLAALEKQRVRYAIIGGVAMRFHASAVLTQDVDLAYARNAETIRRLTAAMTPFHPKLRGVSEDVPFRFDERSLLLGSNFTLKTDVGDVDLLGSVSGFADFETLWSFCEVKHAGGIDVHVLSLAGLIKAKRASGRTKDLNVVPELEALLEVQKRFGKDMNDRKPNKK